METYLAKVWQLSCETPAVKILLSVIYFLLFLLTSEMMIKRRTARNFYTASLNLLFLSLALVFSTQWFLPPEHRLHMPWLGVLMAVLPAILFVYFRTHYSGAEESVESMTRFNQLKDEFLSVASHELRTPLSVINGFAEILVREKLGTLNDEQKRRVRKILMQAQRLNRIVDELLDLSRIRSGKVQIRHDVFDLVPVLKACLDDHQIVCEQQNIILKDDLPDVLPDVAGDIERITQIVVNLLNNAIKYTEPGGTVTLAASYRKARNEIYIEIRDSGIGIDLKDQPRVFEEFFRCNHNYARRYSGSGLGLAIVKQLVEVHEGHVGVFSEGLGKGSTFFFTLRPATKGEKEQAVKPTSTSLIAQPTPRSSAA
jgi:signal transduction histidine kinase